MKKVSKTKQMEIAGSLTPDLEGAPRSASHSRRPEAKKRESDKQVGGKKS